MDDAYGCGGWAGWPSPLSRWPGGQTGEGAGETDGAGDDVATGVAEGAVAGGWDATGCGADTGAAGSGVAPGATDGTGVPSGSGVTDGAGDGGDGRPDGAPRVRSGACRARRCGRCFARTLRVEVRLRACGRAG
jgi:hypothetical protein